jgi:uncharacterized protein YecT (DUF1311 family)
MPRLALFLLQGVLLVAPTMANSQVGVPATMEEAEREWETAVTALSATLERCDNPESATIQSIVALHKAQEMWVPFRDQSARAFQLKRSDRKPIDDLYYVHARAMLTAIRIAELKALYGCE